MMMRKQPWSRARKIWTSLTAIILVLAVLTAGVGYYFFTVAVVRSDKSFITGRAISKGKPLYVEQQAFLTASKTTWHLTAQDGTKLVGNYWKADKPTTKTVLVVHGFGVDHVAMAPYGTLFHKMGYNVLLPDNRAAGKSGGKYIGYGYLEAKDMRQWIQKIIKHNGQQSEIVVMGASLGGATTMTLSGMNTPTQVKAFIEDAGYSSTYAELFHEAQDMYHLPYLVAWPLIHVVSIYAKILAGYSIGQATPTDYLAKNHKPMLFIHGGNDTFVPTAFLNQNYNATKGIREKYKVPGAAHVQSYATNPTKYQAKVAKFLAKYFK